MRNAYALRRPVENTYLVRERDRRRRRELVVIVMAALPLGLCLLVYIWSHLQVLDAGYRIDSLEQSLHALSQQERRLRLEAALLSSPQRIEQRAVDELGMAPPRRDQMVFLERLP
ncbi:MAG: cell division protein FtsL [Acidobacteria bacterium]|nr:cell division protein FtsL [Acidobacteriota bacterium]